MIIRLQLARINSGWPAGVGPDWVCVADWNNWMLLKEYLNDDATPLQNGPNIFTVADLTLDANKNVTDIDSVALTGAQKTAWASRLSNAGAGAAKITAFTNNVNTRKDLAVFIGRILMNRADIDEGFIKFRNYLG